MKELHWLLRQRDPKMQPQWFVEKNFQNYENLYRARNWWEVIPNSYDRVYLFATERAREDMTTLYNMWLDSCLFDNNITNND